MSNLFNSVKVAELPPVLQRAANSVYHRAYVFPSFPLMFGINRIEHRSLMQPEKSQPEGKRIMPETRFTVFPA